MNVHNHVYTSVHIHNTHLLLLLLLAQLLLSGVLSSLLTLTPKLGVSAGLSQDSGDSGLAFIVSDGACLDTDLRLTDGEDALGNGGVVTNGSHSLSRRISLLVSLRVGMSGEDNQFGFVLFQSLDIGFEGFVGFVLASVINTDSNT